MAEVITTQLIKNTPSNPDKLTWLYDSKLPGFAVRVSTGGTKSYVLIYTRAGQQRRYTLGKCSTLKIGEARDLAKATWKRIEKGHDPMERRHRERQAETLKDICLEYRDGELLKKRPTTQSDFRYMIDKIVIPALGSRKVETITKADVKRLHRKVTKKNGPYRANRVVSIMSILLNEADDAGYIQSNPISGKKKWLNHEPGRQRFLSQVEIVQLSAALKEEENQTAANIIRLLLLTGARKGEVLNATWDQFNFETGCWTRPSSHNKQKQDHTVPLSPPTLQLLQGLENGANSDLLFPGGRDPKVPFQGLTKCWDRIREREGLNDVHVHDLRHTYASILANKRASLPLIGARLGHTQSATTDRYSHLSVNALQEWTDLVGETVVGQNPKSGPENVVPLRGEMH